MSGWPNMGSSHTEAETGGVPRPPVKAMCASCNRRRLVSDMVIETNERSGAHGFLVCNEPWQQGGCFEGVYPDLQKREKADDIGPIPNIFY